MPRNETVILALTQLSVWLIKLGVQSEITTPGCPGQNARHERMPLALKTAMTHHDVFWLAVGAAGVVQQMAK